MKKKIFTILFILLVAALTAGSAYAYWVGNVKPKQKDEIIELGEAQDVEITLDLQSLTNKKLVPKGLTKYSVGGAEANTELIKVTYLLTVGNDTTDYTFYAEVVSKTSDLLNVEVVITGNVLELNITLDEPATKQEYLELQALGTLELTIVIEAEAVTP